MCFGSEPPPEEQQQQQQQQQQSQLRVPKVDERPFRIFSPGSEKWSPKHNAETGLTTLKCVSEGEFAKDQLLLQICAREQGGGNTGRPVFSSTGVYFARNSPYNKSYADAITAKFCMVKTILAVVQDLVKEKTKPITAVPLQQVVIQIDGAATYDLLTKDVWNWRTFAQNAFTRDVGTVHNKLLEAKNQNNLIIKFQTVNPNNMPGAGRLAEIAIKNPKTYAPKSNPQQARGNPNQGSSPKVPATPAAPPSHSNKAWYYVKDYKNTDPEVMKNIDKVLLRLEYPIGKENEWCKSIISFVFFRDLSQVKDVSSLHFSFISKFGLDYKTICKEERAKIILRLRFLERSLQQKPPENFAFKGHDDFVDKHTTIAELSKLLGKLEKDDLVSIGDDLY